MSGEARAGAEGGTLVATHHPVMGTDLELQITAGTEGEARAAEAAALDEARRLEAMFTVFDPASDLCRWRSGAADAGPELTRLLGLAARWQRRSGTFNPLSGALTARWLQAVDDGEEPSSGELADLAATIAEPRFSVDDGVAVQLGDCRGVDLNAIAKGHVVDLVAERIVREADVARLVVNAGGDLVHRGAGGVRVAVEDPHRPYDNVEPLTWIEVADAAVATSGGSRRWFDVGGRRWSRVLDPRTGQPVDAVASATVVAPDAATADVLATVASVLEPAESVALLADLAADGLEAAVLVVDRAGCVHASPGWPSAPGRA